MNVVTGRDKVCPICKKGFVVMTPIHWLYKSKGDSKTKYFCSFDCWSKAGYGKGRVYLGGKW